MSMRPVFADFCVRRDNFELSIDTVFPAGQVTAVIGPNGAGKSTLLQALAGFVPISEGTISSGNVTWADTRARVDLPAHRRSAAILPQSAALFPHLTVSENILFGPRSRKLPEQKKILDFWLTELGLDGLEDRWPRQISGGQQQRAALARAFAAAPGLLLLDEPTSALDVSGAEQFRQVLRKQLTTQPVTTLLASHTPADVLALADRVIVLEDGEITASNSLQELWLSPNKGFAAAFADVNSLEGTLIKQAGRSAVVSVGTGLELEGAALGTLSERVLVSIPPGSLRISQMLPQHPTNQWSTTVESVVTSGTGFSLGLRQPSALTVHIGAADFWRQRVTVGAKVQVSVTPADVTIR